MLIAIEGIDGSGKGTQAKRLHERLSAEGTKAALIGFPRYAETHFGRAVGEFLNGRFGELDQVHPLLVSLLYAGDRFESRSMLLQAQDENDVVVLDRYVASNLAHQGAKCRGPERDELIGWIEQVEHRIHRMPRPDLVILLDLPVETAQRLIAVKQKRAYTDRAADLQEADADYLEQVRAVYRQLAEREPNWRLIDCLRRGELRSVDEIGEEMLEIVRAARS